MPVVVIYDASVLYPAPLRDLLLRIARAGLVRARWSEMILDECFEALRRQRPELPAERLQRTRELMVRAVPDCLVDDYESLIGTLVLPDPDDRHVLAAAIRAGAHTIVTANLRDFPPDRLEPYDVEAQSPDEFVLDLVQVAPEVMLRVLAGQADELVSPPQSVSQLLDTLEHSLPRAVRELRLQLPPR